MRETLPKCLSYLKNYEKIVDNDSMSHKVSCWGILGWALAFALLYSQRSEGATVLEVKSADEAILSVDGTKPWKIGDHVCVMQKEEPIACGKITQSSPTTATVRVTLKMLDAAITAGQTVVLVDLPKPAAVSVPAPEDSPSPKPSPSPTPAALQNGDLRLGLDYVPPSLTFEIPSSKPLSLDVTSLTLDVLPPPGILLFGYLKAAADRAPASGDNATSYPTTAIAHQNGDLMLGLDYIFPSLTYQIPITSKLCLGVTSLLVNFSTPPGTSLEGFGGVFSVNYYESEKFTGFWLQGGFALFPLTATVNGIPTQIVFPAVMGTVGWRWMFPSGFNVGFATGVHLLLLNRALSYSFPVLSPSLILDVGYAF